MPMWAVTIGIAAAGTGLQLLLAPRPKKQAPVDVGKFDDVRVQGADYGADIPRGWGQYRTAGNIVFSNGIQHYVIDEPTTGGKGVPQAPATRRHVYQSSFAILIARGPVNAFLRVWEDADLWIGGIPTGTSASFEAEDATLSGGASIATVNGTTFVHNIGNGGEVLFDFTTLTPPANPYDPDENAEAKTFVEIYYMSPDTRTATITYDNGSGPQSNTVTFETSGGEWTAKSSIYSGFVESWEISNPSGPAPAIDYIYVTFDWVLPNAALPIPYYRISGAVNPDIIYPPDVNDPSAYYNADLEDLKDGVTDTYSFETSIPGDVYRWYTGTETQTADPIIQEWLDARYGPGEGALRASAMRGLVYVMFGNHTLRQARPANYTFEISTGPDDVNDILEDLCEDVGIDLADTDFTDTVDLTQIGFLENANASRASLFDQLQNYHLFRRAEIDGQIKTIPHSFTSVYTVDVDDLRAHDDTEEMPPYDAEVVVAEEHLLPREMRFSIMNPQRDYHNETATAQLFTVPGTESEEVNFNIIDDLENARLQVEKALLKKHSESQAIEISCMPELAQYSVGDVITVPINGVNTNIRIEKKQMTLPIGKVKIQGVTVTPFTPTYYQSDTTLTANLAREQVTAFNFPRNSVVVAIQGEAIREADEDKLGVYLAPCGRGLGAGENIAIYREFGEDNYIIQFVADTPAQVGLCEDVLGTHGDITTKDTTNTLDIWFFDAIELESISTGEIDRYPNVNLLRVGDEWIQFETAVAQVLEDNSPYRAKWRVSNLWRGRFNTQDFKGSHAADEYAVHATHALQFYELEEADIGQAVNLKAVTGGQAIELAPETEFVFAGGSIRRAKPDLIFEHYTTVATTDTSKQTLYSDTIDAGTWANDGDLIECEYSGYFAANGNSKDIVLFVAGTEVGTISVTESGTKWSIEVEIMRSSSAKLIVTATLSYGDPGAVSVINEILTGLDLDDTDYDVMLQATTPTAAGDIGATMGAGKFWKGTGELILTDDESEDDLTDEVSAETLIA